MGKNMLKTAALVSGLFFALTLVGCGSGSGSSNTATPAFKVTVSGS